MLTETIKHPTLGNVNIEFTKGMYSNNRLAIVLNDMDTFQRFCVLTVNIPEVKLEPDEFIVKGWSENESTANTLRNSSHFIDTGKRVPTGHVVAEIWKFRDSNTLHLMTPIK